MSLNNVVNMSDPSGFRPLYISEEEVASRREALIVECKTFYVEKESPSVSYLGKTYRNNLKGFEEDPLVLAGFQLLSSESGIAKVIGNHNNGMWYINSPALTSDIGVSISFDPEASLYGKASLIEFGSSVYIPLPFTNNKLEIGGAIDMFSIGGGLSLKFKGREKGFKAGLHVGVGFDIIVNLK